MTYVLLLLDRMIQRMEEDAFVILRSVVVDIIDEKWMTGQEGLW